MHHCYSGLIFSLEYIAPVAEGTHCTETNFEAFKAGLAVSWISPVANDLFFLPFLLLLFATDTVSSFLVQLFFKCINLAVNQGNEFYVLYYYS